MRNFGIAIGMQGGGPFKVTGKTAELSIVLAIALASCAGPSKTYTVATSVDYTATYAEVVTVRTDPAMSEVYLNGDFVGKSPVEVNVGPFPFTLTQVGTKTRRMDGAFLGGEWKDGGATFSDHLNASGLTGEYTIEVRMSGYLPERFVQILDSTDEVARLAFPAGASDIQLHRGVKACTGERAIKVTLTKKPYVPIETLYPDYAVELSPSNANVLFRDGNGNALNREAGPYPQWTAWAAEDGRLFADKHLSEKIPGELSCDVSARGYWPTSLVLSVGQFAGEATSVKCDLVGMKRRTLGVKTLLVPLSDKKELGSYSADLVSSLAAQSDFLSVLERESVDSFFDERGLQETDLFDPSKRATFELLGAHYLIVGSIRVGDSGSTVSLRVDDIRTGIVVASSVATAGGLEDALDAAVLDMTGKLAGVFLYEDSSR
jgi:hypothetical protein